MGYQEPLALLHKDVKMASGIPWELLRTSIRLKKRIKAYTGLIQNLKSLVSLMKGPDVYKDFTAS